MHDEVESNPPSRELFEADPPAARRDPAARSSTTSNSQGFSIVPFAELFSAELWEELTADAGRYTRDDRGGSSPAGRAGEEAKKPKPGKPAQAGEAEEGEVRSWAAATRRHR